jgi:hypothetical protein
LKYFFGRNIQSNIPKSLLKWLLHLAGVQGPIHPSVPGDFGQLVAGHYGPHLPAHRFRVVPAILLCHEFCPLRHVLHFNEIEVRGTHQSVDASLHSLLQSDLGRKFVHVLQWTGGLAEDSITISGSEQALYFAGFLRQTRHLAYNVSLQSLFLFYDDDDVG